MRLPHDSLAGTLGAGFGLTLLLYLLVRLLV
jgi:hypothetical protein